MQWIFEPGHTAAAFRARHMMVSWVRGSFKNIKGKITFDPDNIRKSSCELKIPAKTIWTGVKGRDEHLRSKDFLWVDKYPHITFKSAKVEPLSEQEFKLQGKLTIRGITKKAVLNVLYVGQWKTPFWVGNKNKGPKQRAGFVATTTINRHDFNVSWNDKLDKGGMVVSDDVHIVIDVEALKE